jgi:hypothetical protein
LSLIYEKKYTLGVFPTIKVSKEIPVFSSGVSCVPIKKALTK